jgi:uncharacterized protein (DUF1697 family)
VSWVALLRAVNVGGRTVRMERLRTLFEALAFTDVATVIASGNVVFRARGQAAALERRIERALLDGLGFEVTTFLRTADELAATVGAAPFGTSEGRTLMVGFLKAAPQEDAVSRVLAFRTSNDELCIAGRELWWRRRGGNGDSKLGAGGLEKALGAPMTMRNITTVRRLAELSGARRTA